MIANVLTPLKSEWEKFTSELIFHLHITDEGDDTWNSNCDASFKLCRNIISSRYPEFDLEATIEYFRKSGWFCDCEVFCESPSYLGKSKVEVICQKV
jgi:hypothetical protein